MFQLLLCEKLVPFLVCGFGFFCFGVSVFLGLL